METPNQPGNKNQTLVVAAVAIAVSAVIAAVAWALIGYYIASTLSLGLILLPLASGAGAGFVARFGRQALAQRIGVASILATLFGCVVGDLVWISLFTQKPIAHLLGPELVPTLNTLFNLQKAVMYAVAAYLAYAITLPGKPASHHDPIQ